MESDCEDYDDLFEGNENNENDTGIETTENKSSNETPEAVKVAAPKRIVKNPRLKFNPERLCGERGIPVLMDHFKNVKFKGSGHEVEDLDKLMSKLEHWAHRLFPSMKFEDCLTHIEKLGKKRQVQACLSKIRLDMPILNSDFVKDNEDDDVKRNDDPEPEEISAFDRLLVENGEMSSIDVSVSAPEIFPDSSSLHASPMPPASRSYVLGSSFGSSLTEEQKERMERNKMLAAEKRKARLAAMEQNNQKSQYEDHEATLDENVPLYQNSFDKLLELSKHNKETLENSNSGSECVHEVGENSKISSSLNDENSEKLGLDDLIDLVDEEDPILDKSPVPLLSEHIDSNYSESVSKKQNSFNKLLNLSECNKENTEKIKSSLEISLEFGESSKASTFLSHKNSEKLELDDLVDEDDSALDKNAATECSKDSANNFDMEINHDLGESSKISLDLSNKNSEKLELDDLMNLVDEDDPGLDKNAATECNKDAMNNFEMEINHDLGESSKISLDMNNENSEKLELDDSMNLVDEEDPV